MGIRWNPWVVSQALDEVEQALDKAAPHITEAMQSLSKAKEIPNLPGYMYQWLAITLDKLGNFDKQVRGSVRRAREQLPQRQIEKAQAAATQQSMSLMDKTLEKWDMPQV